MGRMQDRGVALASNQVQYSLLYRAPETNGVADATRDAGATLIAYSPLCQGLLTGEHLVLGVVIIGCTSPLISCEMPSTAAKPLQ